MRYRNIVSIYKRGTLLPSIVCDNLYFFTHPMRSTPFAVSPDAARDLDYCFHRLCWGHSPEQIRSQNPYLARRVDFDQLSAYLSSQTVAVEYISPFFPTERARAFCAYKIAQGWTDQTITDTYPQTARMAPPSHVRQRLTVIETTRCLLAIHLQELSHSDK